MTILPHPISFEWDAGNKDKNLLKHGVSNEECEEVFFDPGKRMAKDTVHSGKEARYILLGGTLKGRSLFVVFTLRRDRIRVISARNLNRKEARLLL